MKKKIIPFDLETAKKIQAGEITGAIKTINGLNCKIVSYCNGSNFFIERETEACHLRWCYPYTKDGRFIDGKNNGGTDYDIVLEVYKNKPLKPFDKVLCRDSNDGVWRANLFSHERQDVEFPYYVCGGSFFRQCIPYEGHEYLVGTTDKPKED